MSMQSRIMHGKLIPAGLFFILFLGTLLTACGVSDVTPLAYGVWDQSDTSLKAIQRVNADGTNPTSIIESTTGLVVQKLNGHHNYSNPLSPDGKYLAVYAQNSDNNWELNILPTHADAGSQIFKYSMGTQPTLSIAGFSPSSRYFVFTEQDAESGLFTIQIYDLKAKTLLVPKAGAFFADFVPGSDDLLSIGVGPTGEISGVQRVGLPSRTEKSIYKPPESEQIGLLIMSPDQKNLLIYDLATKYLNRVPLDGSQRTTLYQFNGDIGAAFAPTSGYLAVTDLSESIQRLVVFSPDFREVYRQDGIGSGTLAFSPDGKSIAFQGGTPEKMSLNILNLDPLAKPAQIADSGVYYAPKFSPDGSRIVFIEYKNPQEKTGELYTANVGGSEKKKLDTGVTSFTFGVNNTLLYFKADATDLQAPKSSLLRVGLDGTGQAQITQPLSGFAALLQ